MIYPRCTQTLCLVSTCCLVLLTSLASTKADAPDKEIDAALKQSHRLMALRMAEFGSFGALFDHWLEAERIAEDLVEQYGQRLLPRLEARIKTRSSKELKSLSQDDFINHVIDWIAVAKLAPDHDVTRIYLDYAKSPNRASPYVSEVIFLPPLKLRAVIVRLKEAGLIDRAPILLMEMVGDENTLEELRRLRVSPLFDSSQVNVGMMKQRLEMPEETQLKWMNLDLRFRVLAKTGGGFHHSMKTADGIFARRIAVDQRFAPTRDYMSALKRAAREDVARLRQLRLICMALTIRGDRESVEVLRSTMSNDLEVYVRSLTDFSHGCHTLILLLEPGGKNNERILQILERSGSERHLKQLDLFINDDSYSEDEQEALRQTRDAILERQR